jgi:hypothetical protein
MSKKFDAKAYVARWDAKVIPAMIGVIVVSLVLAVILNVATRPDCLRHEYIFCGTEAAPQAHGEHGAGNATHGASEEAPAHGAQPH